MKQTMTRTWKGKDNKERIFKAGWIDGQLKQFLYKGKGYAKDFQKKEVVK